MEIIFVHTSESFFEGFSVKGYGIIYAFIIGSLLPIFISKTVFYFRISGSHLTDYNCSDEITNEIIKVGIENNK